MTGFSVRRFESANISLGAALICAIMLSCGPKQAATPESKPAEISYPDIYPIDLTAEAGDGSMVVRWRQQGTGTISGYNIFISRESIRGQSTKPNPTVPHNTAVYPGDINPDDSVIEYTAEGLENGVKYYVTVGVVYPDQTMSKRSNEAVVVCGARGEFTLTVRFKSDNDGFSLATGKQVRADASTNDLYMYSKDGVDYLASPSRLDGYLRKSRFVLIGRDGSLEEIRKLVRDGKFSSESGDDKIAVRQGNWVLVRTGEDFSALLHVIEITSVNDSRAVRLSYSFCPLAGEMIF